MKNYIAKNPTKAKSLIEQACKCLKNIQSSECTEKANLRIDEALANCESAKDKI